MWAIIPAEVGHPAPFRHTFFPRELEDGRTMVYSANPL